MYELHTTGVWNNEPSPGGRRRRMKKGETVMATGK
jgi:hypothetical protein